jgi:hypothetical protein
MRIGARARAALDQMRRGDDFAKVAASYSDAPDGLSGGLMGARPLDRLPALYADAVKKLKPGEVSDILRSPAGFHIVKLIDQAGGAAKPVAALKQTRARHILIKVNELVSEAEAKRKLVALKERLENGADFAELARLNSNDLSAAKGGDLGWLYQGDTVPDFEAAMDALKINQISEPVQSPFGFHLIQVLERRTETSPPNGSARGAPGAARTQGRRGLPGLGPANARPRLCRIPRRRALTAGADNRGHLRRTGRHRAGHLPAAGRAHVAGATGGAGRPRTAGSARRATRPRCRPHRNQARPPAPAGAGGTARCRPTPRYVLDTARPALAGCVWASMPRWSPPRCTRVSSTMPASLSPAIPSTWPSTPARRAW